MKDFVRIAAASPALRLGAPAANSAEHVRIAREASEQGVSLLAFPELSLTGYTCGDLFFREDLVSDAAEALKRFAAMTLRLPLVSVVGFPERAGNALYNSAAVVSGGEIVGIVRKRHLANYSEYYERRQFVPAPAGDPVRVFDLGGFRFGVEICEDLWSPVPPSSQMASAGLDLVLNLSASTDFLGKSGRRRAMALQQSGRLRCAYALAAAGFGESTSDAVYGGGSVLVSDGVLVAEAPLFETGSRLLAADIDFGALRYRRRRDSSLKDLAAGNVQVVELNSPAQSAVSAGELAVSPSPFLDEFGEPGWERKILSIQAAALARRMEVTQAEKLVIGVSGGADSALALLGALKALEFHANTNPATQKPKNPNTGLLALVMPGFGSTDATQSRAAKLSRGLGAETRIIDITAACRRHLKDIGHDEFVHDLAYENVQARERTQVLMDVANMERALVVGTGDLSEIALGWNTYNGDHMSMYQLNASVPKTMVLAALGYFAADPAYPPEVRAILGEIAAAPITPELVPDAADNDTEARLGPYELHDFFLYHLLANGASKEKLLELAIRAFRGKYDAEALGRTRDTFFRRFYAAQYKRNCVPDGPKITLSLSPRADWRMPSDS